MAVTYIEGAGKGFLCTEYQRGNDILHVDKIPGLLAIAEDRDPLPSEGAPDENGDGGGVGAVRILAWAEDVEEAEGAGVEDAGAAVEIEIVFPVQLGDRVRGFGFREHTLGFGDGRVVAVNRRRGGVDDFFHAVTGGGIQDIQQALDVDIDGFQRALHRLGDADKSGKIENAIHPGDGVLHHLWIGDRSVDESVIEAIEIFPVSGAQVVQHADLSGLALEVLDKVGAYEARAAGDKNFHGCVRF